MTAPRLNLLLLLASALLLVTVIVTDPTLEALAQRPGHWRAAYLIAPSLQSILALTSLYALHLARRQRQLAQTLLGTLTILFFSIMLIRGSILQFQHYLP